MIMETTSEKGIRGFYCINHHSKWDFSFGVLVSATNGSIYNNTYHESLKIDKNQYSLYDISKDETATSQISEGSVIFLQKNYGESLIDSLSRRKEWKECLWTIPGLSIDKLYTQPETLTNR